MSRSTELPARKRSRCAAPPWACGPVTLPTRSTSTPKQLQSTRHCALTRTLLRTTLLLPLPLLWSLRRARRVDVLSACSHLLVECAGVTRRARIRGVVQHHQCDDVLLTLFLCFIVACCCCACSCWLLCIRMSAIPTASAVEEMERNLQRFTCTAT